MLKKYSDYIELNENFQNAINLKMDKNSLDKLKSYIPTNASVAILKKFFNKLRNQRSSDRANIFVGPYGKGKSHLLLVLNAIVSFGRNSEEDEAIQSFLRKLSVIDNTFADEIRKYREEKKKLLSIFINHTGNDLQQEFLLAINEALEESGLQEMMPNTYFKAALESINRWNQEYTATFNRFGDLARDEYGWTADDIIRGLKLYDNQAYRIFDELYIRVTAGGVFNPLIRSDVTKLIEEINAELVKKTEYGGVFIVFDEFSKFMENCGNTGESADLKLIQDVAELSNRNNCGEIYFICVTHKGLAEYALSVPTKLVDSYRAIEGRFSEIYFTNSVSANYELIANTMLRKHLSNEVERAFERDVDRVINNYKEFSGYQSIFIEAEGEQEKEKLLRRCFPLSPILCYALLQVSEKCAQNERTIFTFLSKKGEGFDRFIRDERAYMHILSADYIYDYFQEIFLRDDYNESVKEIAMKANVFVRKLQALRESKTEMSAVIDMANVIIKSIAVVLIINDLEYLDADEQTLRVMSGGIGDEGEAMFVAAMKHLSENNLIFKSKTRNAYRYARNSNVDLKGIIKLNKTFGSGLNLTELINKLNPYKFTFPKEYNATNHMTRYFENRIVLCGADIAEESQLWHPVQGDGIIYHLIKSNNQVDLESMAHTLSEKLGETEVPYFFCISETSFSKSEEVMEYGILSKLLGEEQYSKEEELVDEIHFYIDEIKESVAREIYRNFPNNKRLKVFSPMLGQVEGYLSEAASFMAKKTYYNTFVLNNEMINKNNITAQAKKAVFEILDNNFSKLHGTGNSMGRTLLKAYLKARSSMVAGDLKNPEIHLQITDMINRTISEGNTSGKQLEELVLKLKGKPFGIRNGVLLLILGEVLVLNSGKYNLFFKGKEVNIEGEQIFNLINSPKDYTIKLIKDYEEGAIFLIGLKEMFNDFIIRKYSEINTERAITAGISLYYRGLPKIVRESHRVFGLEDSTIEQMSIIALKDELRRYDLNPKEFLYEKLPTIFKSTELMECLDKLKIVKGLFDNHIARYKELLIKNTTELFTQKNKSTLVDVVQEEIERHERYGTIKAEELKMIEAKWANITDDYEAIDTLSKTLMNLSIEDWSEACESEFYQAVSNAVILDTNKYARANDQVDCEQDDIKINSKDFLVWHNGISSRENIENDIEAILEDYSLNNGEKASVLLTLLKKIMG